MAFISVNYTSAQTNQAVVSVSAGQKLHLKHASVYCENGNAVQVAAAYGFATATLGSSNIVARHPGIAPGSGFGEDYTNVYGGDDEDIRVTCGAPTSGSIQFNFHYDIIPFP